MATNLDIVATINIVGTYTGPTTVNSPVAQISVQASMAFGFGTGTRQANRYFEESETSSFTGSNLTLGSGGVEEDPFLDPMALTNLKLLLIKNATATSGVAMTVDGSLFENNPAKGPLGLTNTFELPAGTTMMWASPTGYTIASGTSTISHMRSGGTNTTCQVMAVGVQ